MDTTEINPPITNIVVFSGGGGLITREQAVTLHTGINQLTIRDVPASFDPETFVLELGNPGVKLREFVIKKPNRQYVDDNLRREGSCAQRLIDDSIELGPRRPEIIEIGEAVRLRTYLDEEVYLVVWLETAEGLTAPLKLSYFINDARFKWKPTIIVELNETWETGRVKGFIAITNESAKRFDDVEVSFADFAKDLGLDATNERLEPEQFRSELTKQRMNVMKIK